MTALLDRCRKTTIHRRPDLPGQLARHGEAATAQAAWALLAQVLVAATGYE